MRRFVPIFVLLLVALFAIELAAPVQRAVVTPWTEGLASLSARVVLFLDGNVRATGRVLQSTTNGFAVSIEAGCNGIEAALILVSAMLAFPATWRQRVAGIAVGLVTVQLLNVVRVVTLFYIGQWSRNAFDWAHLYVWQALIMLDVLVVWLVWLRWLSAGAAPASERPGPDATAQR